MRLVMKISLAAFQALKYKTGSARTAFEAFSTSSSETVGPGKTGLFSWCHEELFKNASSKREVEASPVFHNRINSNQHRLVLVKGTSHG